MTANISILVYAMMGIIIILLACVLIFEIRLKKLFMGTKAKDLEEVINILTRRVDKAESKQETTDQHLDFIDGKLARTIRNVETVRFNPFEESGSNQSFAISLMNDEGDGVVLSSLYARDRMSVFAKPIKKGKSEFDLTKEEKNVLDRTR